MWCAIANVIQYFAVAPREGRVSRNQPLQAPLLLALVAPREGRVSRNVVNVLNVVLHVVAPREGRVSRNW